MAKRFIDTKIWDKAWFRKLSTKNKLVWIYLLGKCDHAGIWDADFELAEFIIGDTVTYEELPDVIKDKMQYIKGEDQYFIPSFIDFQYGTLKEHSKPHMSVIKRLNDKGLLRVSNKIDTLKDKDKDKEQVKPKDKVKVKDIKEREKEFMEECKRVNKKVGLDRVELLKFVDYFTEPTRSGKKMFFETKPTWSLSRRLHRWKNSDFSVKSKDDKTKKKQDRIREWKKQFRHVEETGVYIAYCVKCGDKHMPNTAYQLSQGSGCCSSEYVGTKPSNV